MSPPVPDGGTGGPAGESASGSFEDLVRALQEQGTGRSGGGGRPGGAGTPAESVSGLPGTFGAEEEEPLF
jgi:hypothetical protein